MRSLAASKPRVRVATWLILPVVIRSSQRLTWNKFHCDDLNSTVITDTVAKISELGLDTLGYKYVNIDDCW